MTVTITFDDLFTPCDHCKGKTPPPAALPGSQFGDCPACNGRGGKLTASGRAVIELIRLDRSSPLIYEDSKNLVD